MAEGSDHDEAYNWYVYMTENRCQHELDKWVFDIVLDCIRNMPDLECERFKKEGELALYHFGYGMYVRNHYVYPSKLHAGVMADDVSAAVESVINSILGL